jgi:hypothetical protein
MLFAGRGTKGTKSRLLDGIVSGGDALFTNLRGDSMRTLTACWHLKQCLLSRLRTSTYLERTATAVTYTMRLLYLFMIASIGFVLSNNAQAQAQSENVGAYYYNDGRIRINNATGSPLASLSVISTTGDLGNASAMIDLPGAIKDNSEFPFAFSYIYWFPVGITDLGVVAKPGLVDDWTFPGPAPVSFEKLHFRFRTLSLVHPLTTKAFFFPEPATSSMVAVGMMGLAAINRKRGRR